MDAEEAALWDAIHEANELRDAIAALRARVAELEAEGRAKEAALAKFRAWAEADEIARTYCRPGGRRDNWEKLVEAVSVLDRLRDEAMNHGG